MISTNKIVVELVVTTSCCTYLENCCPHWRVLVDACLVRDTPKNWSIVVLVQDNDRDWDLNHVGSTLALTNLVLKG